MSGTLWKKVALLEAALDAEEAPERGAPETSRVQVIFYQLGHLPPEHTEGLRRSQAPGAAMDGERVVYLIPVNGR